MTKRYQPTIAIRLRYTLLIGWFCGLATLTASAQSLNFVKSAGGAVFSGEDAGQATATDANGNVYVTGFFSNTATFGSNILISAGTQDVFLAKYNASGTLLWVRQAGGSSSDKGLGIAVDNGGVYITGFFQGTAEFNTPSAQGSNALSSAGGTDIFVAKYDASGEVLWLQRAGGSGADEGKGLSVDNSGVYVTGYFSSTADFNTPSAPNSNTLTSAGGSDIFVAQYTSSGAVQWLQRAGGSTNDTGYGVAVYNNAGNSEVYVTGNFQGTADFNTPANPGSNTLISAGNSDIFVAKYDASGTVGWIKRAGGSGTDDGYGIAVENNGVYVTGDFQNTANFNTPSNTGSNRLTSEGGTDIFVANYSLSGAVGWLRRAGGNDFLGDGSFGIAVYNNEVYVTGYFSGTTNFNSPSNTGNNTLIAVNFTDSFVAKYTSAGEAVWARRAGGTGQDRGIGIAANNNGVYTTGYFSHMANFNTPSNPGSNILASAGRLDMFLAKYDASGAVQWLKGNGGLESSGYNEGKATATDAAGNVYITGHFSGIVTFGNATLTAAGTRDIFVAKYTASGALLWARRAGGVEASTVNGIAVDNNGVYITGQFQGTVNFNTPSDPNSNTLTATGDGGDIFVAKYDASGAVQWLRRAGGNDTAGDGGVGIAVYNNEVYVTGYFSGTTNFNTPSDPSSNTLVTNFLNVDIFVAKYSSAGAVQWLRRAGAGSSDVGLGVTADHSGVYVTGQFENTANFNTPSDPSSNTLSSPGFLSMFVAKYDVSGTLQWLRRAGGEYANTSGFGIAVYNNGGSSEVYVTGYFQNTVNFNTPSDPSSNTLISTSTQDIFVAKYDASGAVQWIRRAGGGGEYNYSTGIAVNNSGVYITGFFGGTANFNTPSNPGSNTLASAGGSDIFVAKYDASGTVGWIKRAGGNSEGEELSNGVAVDNSGVYVTGNFFGTANVNTPSAYGSNEITSVGISDIFFSKWNIDPTITGLAASPATVCAGTTTTFTASIGNVTGSYDFTLTNGTNLTTGTSSATALSQNWIAADFGVQNFTLTVSANSAFTSASTTLTVNTIPCGAVIHVTESGSGLQDGSSWANSLPGTRLQAAITQAASCSAQVWVATGVYKPTTTTGPDSRTISFSMRNNVAIYGGFLGSETALSGRPAVNPVTAPVGVAQPSSSTLSGDIGTAGDASDNSYHVIHNTQSLSLTESAVIDGFVITGGNGNSMQCPNYYGAGIFNEGASPMITNCLFTGNNGGWGGGLLNQYRFDNTIHLTTPIITNCVFTSNSASSGGGMFNLYSQPTIRNVIFRGNYASSGGAIHNRFNGSPSLINSVFESNTALNGGAIYSDYISTLQLTNCTFRNNVASIEGGAIFNFTRNGASTANLINCVLFTNGGNHTFYNDAPQSTTQLSTISLTYSLYEPNAVTATGVDVSGAGNLTTNVSPFASTTSVSLAACSPAIDAGDPATTSATVGATDLAGNSRFFNNARIDMGPYEFQGAGVPISYSVLGSGTATCASSPTITLSGSETGVSYQLQREGTNVGSTTAGTGAALSFGPQSLSGTYTVLATSTSGCTAVMATSATVVSNTTSPALSLSPSSATLTCTSPTVTLTATAGLTSYSFSTGQTGNSNTLVVSSNNVYSVTATGANGCTAMASTTITSSTAVPTVSIQASATVISCPNPTVSLSAVGVGSVLWSTGESTTVISASAAGPYSVTLTNASGCSAVASISIGGSTSAPSLSVTPGSATLTCSSPTVSLSAVGAGTVRWSTGATTPVISVSVANIYSLTLTGSNGCTAVASATVVSGTTAASVSVTPSSGTLSCASPTVSLSAIGTGNVRWSTGSTSPVISATVAGTYSVTLTNANGCTASASGVVSGTLLGNATVSAAGVLGCGQSTVNVTVRATGASSYTLLGPLGYSAVNGTGIFVVSAGGSYTGLAGQSGCVVSGLVTVIEGGIQPTASNFRVSGLLGAGSCSVSLLATATGDRYVVKGSGGADALGYVYSNVYRVVGTRELVGFSVTKPGTYTLTVYSGSCSATYTTVVGGTECSGGQ